MCVCVHVCAFFLSFSLSFGLWLSKNPSAIVEKAIFRPLGCHCTLVALFMYSLFCSMNLFAYTSAITTWS